MTLSGSIPPADGRSLRRPIWRRPARLLGILSGLLIAGMGLIVFVDVVGRYFFNLPLTGSYELIQVTMAALIFAALPAVTARRLHVTVDLIDAALSAGAVRLLQGAAGVISAVALGGMAWHLWILGAKAAEYGDVTSFLRLPLHPVAFGMSGLSALAAIVAFLGAAEALIGGQDLRKADQPREVPPA